MAESGEEEQRRLERHRGGIGFGCGLRPWEIGTARWFLAWHEGGTEEKLWEKKSDGDADRGTRAPVMAFRWGDEATTSGVHGGMAAVSPRSPPSKGASGCGGRTEEERMPWVLQRGEVVSGIRHGRWTTGTDGGMGWCGGWHGTVEEVGTVSMEEPAMWGGFPSFGRRLWRGGGEPGAAASGEEDGG